MNIPEGYKLVKVSAHGVQFGNALFSHESITGYTADQLNAGTCRVTGGAYMAWLSADESASIFDEAKERELFHLSLGCGTLILVNTKGDYQYTSTRAQWEGWKKCAKSRARSAE